MLHIDVPINGIEKFFKETIVNAYGIYWDLIM